MYYDPSDIVRNKQLKPLSTETLAQIDAIKAAGTTFLDVVQDMSGHGSREFSLAKTKIEEAVMWATKAVTA